MSDPTERETPGGEAHDDAAVALVDAPVHAPDDDLVEGDVDIDWTHTHEPADEQRPSWPVRAGRRIVRRPVQWAEQPWPTERIVRVTVTGATLLVATVVMMSAVHLLFGDLVFADTTPTGGDMGAHVWGPAFLRDHLLSNFQLTGWSMDWYAGMPAYRFYMVVPALAMVALDVILPYGVAFKLVAVSGLVTLPFACWAFGRLARFRYPMPELFAIAGLLFALDESFSIYGGNLKSTMAGEFSFSIALSLMMIGLGLLARGIRTGQFRSWAAIVLALAIVCHGIVAIYAAVAALVIVLVNVDGWRRLWYGLTVGLGVVLLSAWWIGPFVGNHQYMTDMKYGARPEGANDSFWDMFFPLTAPLDILVTTLAVVGFLACIARRHVNGVALGVDRPDHRRPRLRDARQPPGDRPAVEPAPAAADLPRPLPADDGRRRRGGRRDRGDVAQPPGDRDLRLARRVDHRGRRRPGRARRARVHVRGPAVRRPAGVPRRQQAGVRVGAAAQDGHRRRRPG